MKVPSFYIVLNPTGSKFAKALQQALRDKVVNKVFRRTAPKPGRSHFAITPRGLDKIEQFRAFTQAQISCPRYATTSEAARELGAKTLFARTIINGTNGRGIVEFEGNAAEYPRAPLYTEYIPKKAEYRCHVFGDQVIDIQEKRKSRNHAPGERNTRVRNLHNGYVYCRDDINPPNGASNLAVRAVQALGYSYGAVDLIYNEKRNQCYVLEVNSRPGLMGTTLDKYSDALINKFNLVRK
jgi:hypothetical protein